MRKMTVFKIFDLVLVFCFSVLVADKNPQLATFMWLACWFLIQIRYELCEIKEKSGKIL